MRARTACAGRGCRPEPGPRPNGWPERRSFGRTAGENCLVSNVRRIQLALGLVLGVILAGTIGYVVLGFGVLDAVYQTVTTISTVGFREIHPLDAAGKLFTIGL